MITSFFPGRLRLRGLIFKDVQITNTAIEVFKKYFEIKNIQHNATTGSILVEYDPTKIPVNKLKTLLPFFEKLNKASESYSNDKKEKILLMLTELDTLLKTIIETTGNH